MGAIIASRIVKHLKGIFKDIKKVFCWSDSTIVLHWIKGSASKYKQFVANRVIEIQETTDPISWRHCSGKHNPADVLTRGLASRDLITFIKWWHGPEWLRDAENLWPKVKEFENELVNSEVTSEYKSCVIVSSAIVQEKILYPGKFSCLRNLLRVTAWVVRFVNALKRKNAEKGPLTSDELTNAEMFWVRITQNDSYSNEITCLKNNKSFPRDSKLLCLNPFLDSNGILRVTGRLGKSTHLSTFEKHPIILPSKTKLTELLIWDSHKRVFHSGVSHTLVQVREKYWILKSRQTIKSVLIEIEGMINSRPITYVGSDTEEATALTPAHFLLGKRITSLPSVRLRLDSNLSSRKCLIKSFNYRERLMRSFWTRWKNEYLLNLRSAHSSLVKNSSPFKVNDVILIKYDHLPRNFWKLGRIIELLPGRDGKVRACKITSQSKFDVTLDRFASRLAAEFIIFMEFFSLILGVDQLAASRLQLDSRNLPEFL
ncbi:hypothetical protein AVEN_27619-1 [Araneus ventricosus]|uniref:DUF5641 domain-containing protein n=1 Tax=Araneus ventricosus TaxID=182803 RepID=A0A4Y2ERP9_ARAVE|nr:hypothetical protein AVEN_27619-1 [Araneus ventricosus]